jgi:hypothetical protein
LKNDPERNRLVNFGDEAHRDSPGTGTCVYDRAMLADIGQYLFDLADNWAAFMTGGIPVAVVAIWERWKGRAIPLRAYFLLFLGVGFAAASFQTWQHEYTARIRAEQATGKGRSAVTVLQLQEFYADAAAFYMQATDAKSDAEFKQTEKAILEWSDRLGEWVTKNMGSGAYIRLIESTGPPPTIKNVKPERVDLIVTMATIRDNLAKFVETSAWDKP